MDTNGVYSCHCCARGQIRWQDPVRRRHIHTAGICKLLGRVFPSATVIQHIIVSLFSFRVHLFVSLHYTQRLGSNLETVWIKSGSLFHHSLLASNLLAASDLNQPKRLTLTLNFIVFSNFRYLYQYRICLRYSTWGINECTSRCIYLLETRVVNLHDSPVNSSDAQWISKDLTVRRCSFSVWLSQSCSVHYRHLQFQHGCSIYSTPFLHFSP